MNRTRIAVFIIVILTVGAVGYYSISPKQSPIITNENASNLTIIMELYPHTEAVYTLDWSPNGEYLASGSQDGTVSITNTKEWKQDFTFESNRGGVWGLSWSPDGEILATAGVGGGVKQWRTSDMTEISIISDQPYWGFAVSWTPQGDALVAGYANGEVIRYEQDESRLVLGKHIREVITVDHSLDGKYVVSGSIDHSINVFSANQSTLINELVAATPSRNDINGLEWNPDNIHLAAASQDGFTRVWNIETGEVVSSFGSRYGGWKRGVAWSPDGSMLVSTGENGRASLLNFETEKVIIELAHESPIWDVVWSPDGRYIATSSGKYGGADDTRLIIWGIEP